MKNLYCDKIQWLEILRFAQNDRSYVLYGHPHKKYKHMKKSRLSIILVLIIIGNATFAQDSLKSITLSEIWQKYSFMSKGVRGVKSLNNGKEYTMIKKGSLVVYDYSTGDSVTTMINGSELIPSDSAEPIRLGSFTMNNDENMFLLPTKTESIYRHSYKADYFIWNAETKELKPLSKDGKQQLAAFSPASDKIAFVRENNLFIKDLVSGKESQITTDGKKNHIINGTCDWVYEEEFGFTKGFYWSPDGARIAYYRFDESKVKEYTLTYYGELYPDWEKYKYPKAGEDNSLVEIYVYELATGITTKMDIGEETDQYIPRIKWSGDPKLLAIQRLNRLQNHLDILLADATSGNSHVMYTEDNDYYIDITDNLTFLENNKYFLNYI